MRTEYINTAKGRCEAEWIIATKDGSSVWTFCKDKESAENQIEDVRRKKYQEAIDWLQTHLEQGWGDHDPNYCIARAQKDIEYALNLEVMTFEDYQGRQAQTILARPLIECSKEEYYEMLEVLPPMNWHTHDGLEVFFMSEFDTGPYTRMFAADTLSGRYFTKVVHYRQKDTWINQAMLPQAQKGDWRQRN